MQPKTEKLADTRTASERAAGVLSPQRAKEFYDTYGYRVRTHADVCAVLDYIGVKAALEAEPEPAQAKRGRQK
jgi:hypothetical protein